MQKILNTVFNQKHWQENPITCFTGNSYPYMFMRKMLLKIEADQYLPVPKSRMQFSIQEPKALLPLIQQTVLGQAFFFWLGDLDEIFTAKHREALLSGLAGYTGENRIAFFMEEIPQKYPLPSIQIPATITIQDGLELTRLFAPKIFENPHKKALVIKLLEQNQELPLNLFMLILDSLDLIHIRHLNDFTEYLTPMLPLNSELSKLSQAFFKRDLSFFKLWSSLSNEYPPIFWLAFWTDQWWRAFHLVTFAQQKNIIQAKKIGFKLPYSFIARDWQSYQAEYFQKLLSQLYEIDYKLKRGHSFCFFDFLYAQHFNKVKTDRNY